MLASLLVHEIHVMRLAMATTQNCPCFSISEARILLAVFTDALPIFLLRQEQEAHLIRRIARD